MNNGGKVGAVIAAAGESERMGGVNKLFAPLAGKPILARVLDVFERCNAISQVVLVTSEPNINRCQQLVDAQQCYKVTDICIGGERRQDSVRAGVKRLKGCGWVVVHDGARPLVTEDIITSGLAEAAITGSAVAAVPVNETVKIAGDDLFVRETLMRNNLWVVQTPQVFRFDIIDTALKQVKTDVTDDASLVEKLGYKVKIFAGDYDNMKITTPDDLVLAEVLWKKHGR